MTAISAEIRGRRRADETSPGDLMPGDYCCRKDGWWVMLPDGHGPELISGDHGWEVEEHANGTISVVPSLSNAPDGYHGFLKRGVWGPA